MFLVWLYYLKNYWLFLCESSGLANQNFQPIELFDSRLLTNGTLSIQSASPQDEGFYLCKATNNIGPGLSKTIFIGVNGMFIYYYVKYVKIL